MHIPVMTKEVLEYLNPQPGQVVVDGTVGAGGHAVEIAQRIAPSGTLIMLDWDESMLELARTRLHEHTLQKYFVKSDYRDIEQAIAECGFQPPFSSPHREGGTTGGVDAILLDLGLCSEQLDDPTRGLAFRFDAPLDMRLDRDRPETAAGLLARLPEREIARILWEYGEERWANAIARTIVQKRMAGRMKTTGDLVAAVLETIPRKFQDKRIHPATRAFQALRIAVNEELDDLEGAIESAARCLKRGGKLCVMSYHSLEDRAVKHTLRRLATPVEIPVGVGGDSRPKNQPLLRLLTKKPIEASEDEVKANPRARSAKLRAAEVV
jgi:16S rRNA (cytosine1402-N4)-methyltransferase